MILPETACTHLDWDALAAKDYPGATGTSHWRSFTSGDLRVRLVTSGPGYLAEVLSAAAPGSWDTFFARSTPIMLTSFLDALSFPV